MLNYQDGGKQPSEIKLKEMQQSCVCYILWGFIQYFSEINTYTYKIKEPQKPRMLPLT